MSSSANSVRREYSRLAARADQGWSRQLARSLGFGLQCLQAAPGATVVDVGCGAGLLLETLQHRRPDLRLIGSDTRPEILALARRRLGRRATLLLASPSRLPLADERADWLVSSSAFHTLSAPSETLNEWYRVLRPGGKLLLSDWCGDYLSMRLYGHWLRLTDRNYQRTWQTTPLRTCLAASGFQIELQDSQRLNFPWALMSFAASKPPQRQLRRELGPEPQLEVELEPEV